MQVALRTLKTRLGDIPHGVRQFIKFCIVGAFNTAIDWGLAYLLLYHTSWPFRVASSLDAWLGLPFQPKEIGTYLIKIISSGTATCNSFFWNRRWTFRVKGKRGQGRQFLKFILVNVGGMILNSTITTLILAPFPPKPPKIAFVGAQATATAIVVFWNFFMNRHWTFRSPKAE